MKHLFDKILTVGAHFDDIEINCGGTLARAAKIGSKIKIIVTGDGEFKNFSGELIRSKETAKNEYNCSLKKLNILPENLYCFEYKDKEIPYNFELVEKIDKIISEFKPNLIITHWIYDSHQDHINTAKSVLSAARYQSSILMWEPIFPSGRTAINSFAPQIYIDISNYQNQKTKALKCYKSQIRKFKKRNINWIDGIVARARYRGFESGCKYAESFQVVRLKINP